VIDKLKICQWKAFSKKFYLKLFSPRICLLVMAD